MSGADTTIMDSLDSFLSGPPSLQYNTGRYSSSSSSSMSGADTTIRQGLDSCNNDYSYFILQECFPFPIFVLFQM
jgi:hypothetical protein